MRRSSRLTRHRHRAWSEARRAPASSSRSSPRRSAAARASASRRCTASSSRAAARSRSTSEPGQGSSFRDPTSRASRSAARSRARPVRARHRAPRRRDGPPRRGRARSSGSSSPRSWRRNGYTVLAGGRTGRQVLELARRHSGPIDLLVTDVVMPGMSGPELSRSSVDGDAPGDARALHVGLHRLRDRPPRRARARASRSCRSRSARDDLTRKVRTLLDETRLSPSTWFSSAEL